MVAFEIVRRRSFSAALASVDDSVAVHVLPTGGQGPGFTDLRQLRYRDFSDVTLRIDTAEAATAAYLRMHSLGSDHGSGHERATGGAGGDASGQPRGRSQE